MPHTNPLHATSVLIDGRVLLLSGQSGSGKSDLALRLIDRGALLIADDYTGLEARGGILYASSPSQIAGRIEIRGIGLVDIGFGGEGPVALMLDLDTVPARMAGETLPTDMLCGIAVPVLAFAALEASAPIKSEQALRMFGLDARP